MTTIAQQIDREKGNGPASANPEPDVAAPILERAKAHYLATKAEAERQQAALREAEARDLAERARPVKAAQHAAIRELIALQFGGTTATALAEAAAALEGFTLEFEADVELAKVTGPDAMPRPNYFPVRLKRDGLADLIVGCELVNRTHWQAAETAFHYYSERHVGWWGVQSYHVNDSGTIYPDDDASDPIPDLLCTSFGEALVKAEAEWQRVQGEATKARGKADHKHLSNREIFDRYSEALRCGPRVGRLYTHVKTGRAYKIIDVALNESDLRPLVVYRSTHNGVTWVRPMGEFRERFQEGAAPAMGSGDFVAKAVEPNGDLCC